MTAFQDSVLWQLDCNYLEANPDDESLMWGTVGIFSSLEKAQAFAESVSPLINGWKEAHELDGTLIYEAVHPCLRWNELVINAWMIFPQTVNQASYDFRFRHIVGNRSR